MNRIYFNSVIATDSPVKAKPTARPMVGGVVGGERVTSPSSVPFGLNEVYSGDTRTFDRLARGEQRELKPRNAMVGN